MRKISIAMLVPALLLADLGAAATARKPRRFERVEQDAYTGPAVGTQQTGPLTASPRVCDINLDWGCARVPAYPHLYDKFVAIEIADESGLPVAGRVYQCGDDGCNIDDTVPICGRTEKPLKVEADSTSLGVMLFEGPCTPEMTPAAATSGTVVFTFSNRS